MSTFDVSIVCHCFGVLGEAVSSAFWWPKNTACPRTVKLELCGCMAGGRVSRHFILEAEEHCLTEDGQAVAHVVFKSDTALSAVVTNSSCLRFDSANRYLQTSRLPALVGPCMTESRSFGTNRWLKAFLTQT